MVHAKVDEVCELSKERFGETIERLGTYLRYPAISCDAAHFEDVRRLAHKIRDDLEALGFARPRVLELDDALCDRRSS